MRTPAALLVLALLTSLAMADEVTLKNGQVRKNLKLLEETATAYRFRTVDGKTMTIKKGDVTAYVSKPSSFDELETRLKAAGENDAAALFAISEWAKAEGMRKEVKDVLLLAIKADPDHLPAREALGQRKLEGEWIDADDYEKTLKARGYKKIKGEWYSQADARRLTKGLIRHEDYWVTKKIKAKIDKDGWVYHAGEWMDPEDKQKMESGLRKKGKRWVPIDQLDAEHSDLKSPWILKDRFVEVWSDMEHARAQQVLERTRDVYASCVELFGRALDIDDDEGRIRVVAAKDLAGYKRIGAAFTDSDRSGTMSAGLGVFYTLHYEDKQPAVCTYWHDRDFLNYWIGFGVSQAFVTRIVGTDEKPTAELMNVLGAYASCFHAGKYNPTWFQFVHDQALKSENLRRASVSGLLQGVDLKDTKAMMRAGFAVHFLASRSKAQFQEFLRDQVLKGSGTSKALFEACTKSEAPLDEAALAKEFFEFVSTYQRDYRPWDQK